jgi:putative Mn2+ efflux pump MntP
LTTGAIAVVGVVLWAPFTGAASYYGDLGTIGTLALILVYMGVTIAESMNAAPAHKPYMVIAYLLVGLGLLAMPQAIERLRRHSPNYMDPRPNNYGENGKS